MLFASFFFLLKMFKECFGGGGAGLAVKSTYCSPKGPELGASTHVGWLTITYNSGSRGSNTSDFYGHLKHTHKVKNCQNNVFF